MRPLSTHRLPPPTSHPCVVRSRSQDTRAPLTLSSSTRQQIARDRAGRVLRWRLGGGPNHLTHGALVESAQGATSLSSRLVRGPSLPDALLLLMLLNPTRNPARQTVVVWADAYSAYSSASQMRPWERGRLPRCAQGFASSRQRHQPSHRN
jgi:hypothetical protein